jgi:hypothetical protein
LRAPGLGAGIERPLESATWGTSSLQARFHAATEHEPAAAEISDPWSPLRWRMTTLSSTIRPQSGRLCPACSSRESASRGITVTGRASLYVEDAKALLSELPEHVHSVLLFASPDPDVVRQVARWVRPDYVQVCWGADALGPAREARPRADLDEIEVIKEMAFFEAVRRFDAAQGRRGR